MSRKCTITGKRPLTALRSIDKVGLHAFLRKNGLTLQDIT